MKITLGKVTVSKKLVKAEEVELPKTRQLLKTLNPHKFGATWDKSDNTIHVYAEDTPRSMQFSIISRINEAILSDTGTREILVQSGTSYTPHNLTISGKLR